MGTGDGHPYPFSSEAGRVAGAGFLDCMQQGSVGVQHWKIAAVDAALQTVMSIARCFMIQEAWTHVQQLRIAVIE